MTTLEEIEKAVTQLTPDEMSKFRAWFEDLQAQLWDQQIERDSNAGKLDRLADQALANHTAGKSHRLQ